MECRPLEISLISAEDLKNVNRFTTMDVFAEAKIHGDDFNSKQKQKSPVHKDCGSNPRWNHKFNFTIHKDSRLILQIKLISDRTLGNKEIGRVYFAIKELLDNKAGKGSVSYAVRTPDGESKGTLKFAFKIGEKFEATPPVCFPGAGGSSVYPAPGSYPYAPPHYADDGEGQAPYPYPPPQGAFSIYTDAPGYGYGGYPAQPGYGGFAPPPVVQKPQKPKKGFGGMGMG